MNYRSLTAALLLAPCVALAQWDDWSSFPAAPPPPPKAGEPAPRPRDPPPAPKGAEKEKAKAKEGDGKKDARSGDEAFVPSDPFVPANPFGTLAPGESGAGADGPPPPPAWGDAAPPPGAEDGQAPGEEPRVISHEEKEVLDGEPHSPATRKNGWTALSNRRVTPSAVGASGLLNTSSAALGPKNILRFGVLGEYFARGDFPVRGASHVRSAGTFSASWVPLTWLEAYLAYGASANSNSFSSPTLIQTLGDVNLGAKVSREWTKGLYAGLDLRALSFPGVGSQDVGGYAWGFAPRAILTWDVRRVAPKVPLVLHFNAGVQFDGTGSLVREHTLDAAEEFALGVHRYHRFVGAAALEAPMPFVTPFVEYDLGLPLGVEGGELESPDGVSRVPVDHAMPQKVGLGLKVTAFKDLTLVTGAQLGLARTVGLGVPATQPWNVYLGASFNVDPFGLGKTRVVETLRERTVVEAVPEAPKKGKVEGIVLDKETQKPIPGVIVAMVGAGLPPVASDAPAGRFLTHDLGEGPVTLLAAKDGYKQAQQEVMLAAGQTAQVQLVLEPEAKLAHFLVTVSGGEKTKAPVAAQVKFKGPVEEAVSTDAGVGDARPLDVPPGRYLVNVVSPGHLAQTREVQVSEDAQMKLHFDLEPEPKKRLVVVREDKIEILQQVHFATNKATLLPRSHGLLNEVVDAIVTNDISRIRVEGHTDNRGGKARNKTLSEERARSVADYLVKQGIDPGRIETSGFGDERPVAPNLTARGRELNRRVEFHIIAR